MNLIHDNDLIDFMGNQESQSIRPANDFVDDVIARFENPVTQRGDPMPWKKTHDIVRFREGEVTLWAGINGHGKSLVVGQIMLGLMSISKVAIASMEMLPDATMERMIRQVARTDRPTNEFIRWVHEWTKDRLWLYDETDSVEADRIIAMINYCATKLGIKHIAIDSLAKCGIGTDDYNRQKEFVDRLCWAAKRYKIHIHLVHHIRKSEREGKIPDKFDVKGAGEIVDLVDNCLLIHRNKDKEGKIELGQTINPLEPDTSIIVAKQRHGEWEGKIALYFDKLSQQMCSNPNYTQEWLPGRAFSNANH